MSMSLQLEHLDLNRPGFLLNRTPKTDEKPQLFENLTEIGLDAIWSLSSAKSGNGTIEIRDNNSDTFWQSDGPQPHLVDVQFAKKQKISEINIYLSQKLDESYAPKTISIRIGNSLEELVEIQVVDIRHSEGWVVIPLALPSPVYEKINQAADKDEFDLEELRESRTQTQIQQAQMLSETLRQNGNQTDSQLRETLATIKCLCATQYFHRILPKLTFKDSLFDGAVDYVETWHLQIGLIANHQQGKDSHVRQIKIFGPKLKEKTLDYGIRVPTFIETNSILR